MLRRIHSESIVLLLLLMLAEVKPFLPYAEYYLNYEHIVDVLCVDRNEPISMCQGRCYLNDQLQKSQQQEDDAPTAPIVKWEKTPFLVWDNPKLTTIRINTDRSFVSIYQVQFNSPYYTPPSPPPEC